MDETWGVPLSQIGAMTHWPEQPPNPAIVELARRLQLTGQNLYNTWIAPAQRLGEAATSGTLDVTDPQTAGDAFGLVGGVAGARMPFAKIGELGSAGGKLIPETMRPTKGDVPLSEIGNEVPALKVSPSIAEQVKGLGGEWANRPVIDAQGNVIHNSITSEHVSGPILRLNEDGTLTKGILAYHGSPHDFDRFDLSRIGTGEGAQAYGHGLYFAENPGVAESYKQGGFQHLPEAVSVAEDNGRWAVYVGGRKKALTYAGRDEASAAADQIAKEISPKGKMYQVAIKADPEHFLDWDKPLSEQHHEVKQRLKQIGIDPERPGYLAQTMVDDLATKAGAGYASGKGEEALRQAGIPGIKYLDQQSRAEAPQPTRNYVVFDDKTIDILKKYGLIGLFGGAGAGAASSLPPER